MIAFRVNSDAYRIEKLLGSGGKVRITVNGQHAYEGMATAEEPATFSGIGKAVFVK